MNGPSSKCLISGGLLVETTNGSVRSASTPIKLNGQHWFPHLPNWMASTDFHTYQTEWPALVSTPTKLNGQHWFPTFTIRFSILPWITNFRIGWTPQNNVSRRCINSKRRLAPPSHEPPVLTCVTKSFHWQTAHQLNSQTFRPHESHRRHVYHERLSLQHNCKEKLYFTWMLNKALLLNSSTSP